jgi:hypothetical protein
MIRPTHTGCCERKKHETIHSIKAIYPQNFVFLALTTPLSGIIMEGDSRGTDKSLQKVQPKAKPKPVAKKPGFVRLEPSCWHGRLVAWNTVIQSLEKGVFPSDQIGLAPSRDEAEEITRLRHAHQLKGEFACAFVFLKDEDSDAGSHKVVSLPCLQDSKLDFADVAWFWQRCCPSYWFGACGQG